MGTHRGRASQEDRTGKITPGQFAGISGLIQTNLWNHLKDMEFDFAQVLVEKGYPVGTALSKSLLLEKLQEEAAKIIAYNDWKIFYRKFFNMEMSTLVGIPEYQSGFDRVIIMAYGITPNSVFEAYQRHNIPCWRCTEDLDAVLDWDKEERSNRNGYYAIRVRDCMEPNEALKGLSVNDIKEEGIKTETLTERLIHGLKIWDERKLHLDTKVGTNCTGSRLRDGDMLRVYLHNDGVVCVSSHFLLDSSDHLCSREVVSL